MVQKLYRRRRNHHLKLFWINFVRLTVFVLKKGQEAWWHSVTEIPEGLRQLVSVNSTGSILIKMPENTLPVGDILPKTRELFKYQYVSWRTIAWINGPRTLKAYGPVSVRVLYSDM
jgi:hypothetical protein